MMEPLYRSMPFTGTALPATLHLLRQVILRDGEGGTDRAGAPQAEVEPTELLSAIRRHRLEIVLAPYSKTLGLDPAVAHWLQHESHREQLEALALISAALATIRALQSAGLRVLLFKGPALALQTTGKATSRGRGDLDLLVAPADLPAAVEQLERIGYRQHAGCFPRQLDSFWGRYCRWSGYGLDMARNGQWLDLHWTLSIVRAPLPDFEAAWRERQQLQLNGQTVATLSQRHAFLHTCAHAAKDQWMCLRNLVDIDRLARTLPVSERSRLRSHMYVKLSCAATYAATKSPHLLDYTNLKQRDCRWAIQRAQWAQSRGWRAEHDGPWHPGHWLNTVLYFARFSSSPTDWLRILARFTLPPRAFNNPQTGEDVGLSGMMRLRLKSLMVRLNAGSRSEGVVSSKVNPSQSSSESNSVADQQN